MKKKLLTSIAALLLISPQVYCQGTDGGGLKHNEITIIFDNIFSKSSYYYFSDDLYDSPSSTRILDMLLSTPKAGLGYKFNFNRGAIRSKISFGTNKSSYDYPDDHERKVDYNYFNISGSLGYEFHFDVEKTQLFTGADINAGFSKYFTQVNDQQTTGWYNPVTGDYETLVYETTDKDTQETLGYGISPFIGVKYFITPMFSVSTEMKFFVEVFEESSKSEYSSTNPSYVGPTSTTGPKYSGVNTKLGPLGNISFNIHF